MQAVAEEAVAVDTVVVAAIESSSETTMLPVTGSISLLTTQLLPRADRREPSLR